MPVSLAMSRRLRRSFYFGRVEELGGGACTVYNHMLLPAVFRSLEEDYRHLVAHVQLWDVGCERQVELHGPDAARLAQLMTPRDLGRAAAGQCLYAPLVDVMAAVFGEAVRAIRFFRFAWLEFRGHPLIVARSGWSRQGGFEVYADDPAVGVALWDALWAAGQPFDIGPGCPNLIERVESALLSYGTDMLPGDTPFECGLDRYCNLDRPIEFLGRAALETAAAAGIGRKLRGLRFAGPPCPPVTTAWPVQGGGRRIGDVRSAVWSPGLGTNIAIAMIDRDFWQVGSHVEVETPGGTCPATVADLPFV